MWASPLTTASGKGLANQHQTVIPALFVSRDPPCPKGNLNKDSIGCPSLHGFPFALRMTEGGAKWSEAVVPFLVKPKILHDER